MGMIDDKYDDHNILLRAGGGVGRTQAISGYLRVRGVAGNLPDLVVERR